MAFRRGKKRLTRAAFEVVHADEVGEVAGHDQIAGKPAPIEHGGVCGGIAVGAANGD